MSLREREGRASLFYFFVPVFVRDTEVVVVTALRLLSFPLTAAATDQSPPSLLSCGRHCASFKIDGGEGHTQPTATQTTPTLSFLFFVCVFFFASVVSSSSVFLFLLLFLAFGTQTHLEKETKKD